MFPVLKIVRDPPTYAYIVPTDSSKVKKPRTVPTTGPYFSYASVSKVTLIQFRLVRTWYVLRFFHQDIEGLGPLSTTVPLTAKSEFRNTLKNWIFCQVRTTSIIQIRLVRTQENFGLLPSSGIISPRLCVFLHGFGLASTDPPYK